MPAEPAAEGVQVTLGLLHRMFHVSRDMFSVTDFEGRFIYVNPAWTDVLGWEQEELLEERSMRFVHPDDQAATAAEAGELEDEEYVSQQFTNRYITKQGNYRWLSWTSVSDPRLKLYFSVCRDISETVHMEHEMERLESELTDFAYMTGHDLNSSLAAARTTAAVLKESVGDKDLERVQRLDQSLQQIEALVDKLQQFVRLDQSALSRGPAALQDVASEVLDALREQVDSSGGRVEIHDLPVCAIHPTYAWHIIHNLIANGINYGGDPPHIVLEGKGHGDGMARFTVRDNGGGIPWDEWSRIFRPGVRLDKEKPGSGLGLALVHRITRRHGGTVRVLKSGPRKGTTFEVVLPSDAPSDTSVQTMPQNA